MFSRNWNLIKSEENRNMPGVIAQELGGLNLVSKRSDLSIDSSAYKT